MKKILFLFSLIFLFASVSFAANINWIEKTPMPVPVSAFGYAVVGGNVYIIGGDGSGSSMNTVQRYNTATDAWEGDTNHGGTLAPLPQPRAVLFCGLINGKIHAIGGWENYVYKGDHFIYNPDTNTWSTGPSIPQYPIGQFAATVNNKIYVFGGWWGTYKNDVLEYSEGAGWSAKSPMPTARNHGTTGVYNGKIYVKGGEDVQPAHLDIVEIYDPETNTWTTGLAPMPSPQHWLGSSGSPVSNGIIYVLGPGNTAYGYDPQSDSWNILNSMPGNAYGVAAIKGLIYAIGPDYTFQGVSSPWSMFHHDAQHTGRSPNIGPQYNTKLWTYTTGGEVNSSPAIDKDGIIYVGSEDHNLYAINPDGTLKWAYSAGGGIYSSPAIGYDGTIYVGSWDNNLYAIKQDGTEKWRYSTGGGVQSSPAIADDGAIYVGSYDGKLYALNPDGTLKCTYSAIGVIGSSPAIGQDGIVYVGSMNENRLHAVYPDCTLKWKTEGHSNVIGSSPALSPDGTVIYYGSDDGYLYARNTSDGSLKWKSPLTYGGIQSSPAIGVDGTVYVGTQYGSLWAINPTDGSLKWDYYTTLSAWSSPAIGADGAIYFATAYGHIYAMNPDGSEKWIYEGNYANDGHFRSSPAIGSNGVLYIGSTNSKLYSFGPYPDISVVPASKDFGDVNVGSTSTPQIFTISNTGTADLVIGTLSMTGANASEFIKQNDNCSGKTVASFTNCTVEAVFTPTSAGSKSANLSIPSNDPDTSNLNVPLSGTSVPVSVSLSPDSTSIPRGGTLGYTVTFTNNTSTSQTFQYWTYVTLPNGSRYPTTGELFRPVTVTLSAGQTKSAHLTYKIPTGASLGTYTYYGNVGPYPAIWDSDSFNFTVISAVRFSGKTSDKWELLENNLK